MNGYINREFEDIEIDEKIIDKADDLKSKYQSMGLTDINLRDIIADAIFIVRQFIVREGDTNYSGLTKNSGLFSRIQKRIQALQGVCERPVLSK